jgi:putative CocE/NonD family hydrolase
MAPRAKPLTTRSMTIVPRVKMRGQQLAGWTPKVEAKPAHPKILYDEDVAIELADGTVLLADLFRPKGLERAPVLLSWAAYVKDGERMGGGPIIDESGVAAYLVPRGYTLIRVQPRGTGRSGGESAPEMFGDQEVADCAETIGWIARQPWCDGNVGMTGMSYFGVIQLRVAALRPPALKGIFPFKAFTDIYRHGFSRGGAPYLGAMELFLAFERLAPPPLSSGVRHAASYLLNREPFLFRTSDAAANSRSSRRALRFITPPEASCRGYVDRAIDRTFDSDHWRDRSATASLTNIDLPLCIGTDYGAVGFHLFGAFELWHRTTGDKRMFIGPAWYEFPWSTYHAELVAWYDWQFKGIENGYRELPPVRYWLHGAERWQQATDWPLPDSEVRRLYLDVGTAQDGAPATPLEPQALRWDAPAPSTRSYLALPREGYFPKQVLAYETEILSYRTAPFARDVEITGPLHLHLVLQATAIDAYVMARLSDVAPDGTRRKLAFGWLLASHRTIDRARSNPTEIVHDHRPEAATQLVPHRATELAFSLTPIGNLFRAGHRLLLEVGARPDLLCSEKGDGFDMFLWDPVPYRARNTLVHGLGSYLEVYVRGVDDQTELTPQESPR